MDRIEKWLMADWFVNLQDKKLGKPKEIHAESQGAVFVVV